MDKRKVAKELVKLAKELTAVQNIRTYDLKKGTKFVMPNGTEFVIGKKIKDEFGIAIELINTKTKEKFVNDIEKAVKFLKREKAEFVVKWP